MEGTLVVPDARRSFLRPSLHLGGCIPRTLAGLVGLVALFSPAFGQAGPPRLGQIDFPVSAGALAQQEFVTGVLWMHSFEYPRAAAAFQRAQQLEPGFAMAYWGEAMTHTHPVWNAQNLPAARAILQRLGADPAARRARAPTPREQHYLDAVEVLYGPGTKPARDTLYTQAMEQVVRAHPTDLEAKAFYSLALIGLSQGVRDTATYRRAAAWADTVFTANRNHPGAAHYLIHAFDDPYHAHLGLEAARAYSGIAPDAAHAQHMTTHIFLALGMWDEVISQNTIAMNLTSRVPGHYTSWLHYGLLQQGRIQEATTFLAELRENMASQRLQRESMLAWMRLAHVLASEEWDDGPALWTIDVSGHPAAAQAAEHYFRGLAAARLRSVAGLDSAIAVLTEAEGMSTESAVGELQVQRLELQGLRHAVTGRLDQGITAIRAAAVLQERLPMEFGPPAVAQPPLELLGSLLEVGDPAGAIRAYQRSLELAPGRTLSLMGLARSAMNAGNLELRDEAIRRWAANTARGDATYKPPAPPGGGPAVRPPEQPASPSIYP